MILRECPFCGKKVAIEIKSYTYDNKHHSHYMIIRCECCDFEFPRKAFKVSAAWDESTHEYITDTSEFDETIEKWNRRFIEGACVE